MSKRNPIYCYQGKQSDWELQNSLLHADRLCKLWKTWVKSITITSKTKTYFNPITGKELPI